MKNKEYNKKNYFILHLFNIKINESGFSVIELLIAFTLMAFLAVSLMTIITAGSDAFDRVLDVKMAQSEARIAISYVTVKLRQHSSQDLVSIVPSDSLTNTRNVLRIGSGSDAYADDNYFIYFEEPENGGIGRLVEKNSASATGGLPRVGDPTGVHKIADITDFNVMYVDDEKTIISITVVCDTPNERITREVSVTLRSS